MVGFKSFEDEKYFSSAFNEIEVVQPIAYIEGAPTYNLIPSNFREFTSGSGATSAENRLFKASTGTSVGGYAAIQSFRASPHRVGQGIRTRFSGYFAANVANSWQGIGLISVGEEMSFGYNGTSFGVWHRYGGLPEVRTITISSAASGSETVTLTLNGTAYSIPVTSGASSENAAEIAKWLQDNQSVWGADQLSNDVIVSALSDGAKGSSYSISSTGTLAGSIAQDTAGVTKTSDFISQASWNIDTLDDLDPSNGNLYQIQYQNMGYGGIVYSVIHPVTNKFVDVHRILWPNSSSTLGTPNPSMRSGFYAVSLGSTTDLQVYCSGLYVAVEGIDNRTRNSRSDNNTQSITSTTETQIISLRNRRTYNGLNNQITIQPLVFTVTNETSRDAVVRVRGSTASDSDQIFETAGSNLVGDTSKNPIAYSSGRALASVSVAPEGKAIIDLEKLQISQPPTLKLTVTVERSATGGANTNFTAAINWYEDL